MTLLPLIEPLLLTIPMLVISFVPQLLVVSCSSARRSSWRGQRRWRRWGAKVPWGIWESHIRRIRHECNGWCREWIEPGIWLKSYVNVWFVFFTVKGSKICAHQSAQFKRKHVIVSSTSFSESFRLLQFILVLGSR